MIRAAIAVLVITVASPVAAAEPATCLFDAAAPEPCTVSFGAGAGGATKMRAVGKSGKRVDFVGKRSGGWWSGTLNGKPATGYELNRGNVTFSTRDLAVTFQYYTAGNEHGTY